jgi:hypothetical protein
MEGLCWATMTIITKYPPYHMSNHTASDAHEFRDASAISGDQVSDDPRSCYVLQANNLWR